MRKFYWDPAIEQMICERYKATGLTRLTDNMGKVVKRKKQSTYMTNEAYEGIIQYRASEKFAKDSAIKAANRRGGKADGPTEPTHFAGSQSCHERVTKSAKKNNRKLPTALDVFLETHSKPHPNGGLIFAREKDRVLYEDFEREKNNNQSNKSDNEIWYNLVKGHKKGNVYGVGIAHDIFYEPPRGRFSSATQKYTPGLVSNMENELETKRMKNAERDDQIKKLMETVNYMSSYIQSCNPNFRPPFDPNDPNNPGGDSSDGAGTTNPCS